MTIKSFGVKSLFSFLVGVSPPTVLIQGRPVSLCFAKVDKLKCGPFSFHEHPLPLFPHRFTVPEVYYGLPIIDKV